MILYRCFAWDDVVGMQGAGVDTEAVLHEGMVSFMEGAMLHGVFPGDRQRAGTDATRART